MKLLHHDLVEEFYQSIKEEYPHLTKEQCNDACSYPFKQVREAMESGDFPTVRLQFFGTFVVYTKRVVNLLANYEVMFKEQRIAPVKFFKKKEQLTKFLIKRENEKKD